MRYLLLGLLWRAGRASGYRLQRELSILRGKPVSGGDVYKMLHLLEAEGLVERAPEGGDESFRQRSDCRLSEEGRRQFARWLEQDADSDELYVAQHQFTMKGTTIVAHPWDPSQSASVSDWKEGSNLFNSFEYCDGAEYAVKAKEYPTFADDPAVEARHGTTWRCSFDPNYLIPGGAGNNCAPASLERWSPEAPPEGQMGIHEGFVANIDARTAMNPPQNTTTEKARLTSCASPPCNRKCRESIECLQNGGTVDECWRSITINVTQDVKDALLIPGYTNPSWLIKREVEKDKGGVHWFSREGANCNGRRTPTTPPEANKGIFKLFWDQARDSSELQPVLVVRLAGSTTPTIPMPMENCDAYYE